MNIDWGAVGNLTNHTVPWGIEAPGSLAKTASQTNCAGVKLQSEDQ